MLDKQPKQDVVGIFALKFQKNSSEGTQQRKQVGVERYNVTHNNDNTSWCSAVQWKLLPVTRL